MSKCVKYGYFQKRYLPPGKISGIKVRCPCFLRAYAQISLKYARFPYNSLFHALKTLIIASKLSLTLPPIIWYCFILVSVGISPIFRLYVIIPPKSHIHYDANDELMSSKPPIRHNISKKDWNLSYKPY